MFQILKNPVNRTDLLDWILLGILSIALLFVLSLGMILLIPADFFHMLPERSSRGRMAGMIRFLAGLVLLGIGGILSLPGIPGPGFIFIGLGLFFMGLLNGNRLVEFLRKHPAAMSALNRFRGRFKRPPLNLPD